MRAPALRYASSEIPEPTPAPCSMRTSWPARTRVATPPGLMPTRDSSLLISLGIPTITVSPLPSPRGNLHHERGPRHAPVAPLVLVHPPVGELERPAQPARLGRGGATVREREG